MENYFRTETHKHTHCKCPNVICISHRYAIKTIKREERKKCFSLSPKSAAPGVGVGGQFWRFKKKIKKGKLYMLDTGTHTYVHTNTEQCVLK